MVPPTGHSSAGLLGHYQHLTHVNQMFNAQQELFKKKKSSWGSNNTITVSLWRILLFREQTQPSWDLTISFICNMNKPCVCHGLHESGWMENQAHMTVWCCPLVDPMNYCQACRTSETGQVTISDYSKEDYLCDAMWSQISDMILHCGWRNNLTVCLWNSRGRHLTVMNKVKGIVYHESKGTGWGGVNS